MSNLTPVDLGQGASQRAQPLPSRATLKRSAAAKAAKYAAADPDTQPAGNPAVLIAAIGGGAALLLVGGFIAWMTLGGNSDSDSQVAQSPPASPTSAPDPASTNSTPSPTTAAQPAAPQPAGTPAPAPQGAAFGPPLRSQPASAAAAGPATSGPLPTTPASATAGSGAGAPKVVLREDNGLNMKLCRRPPGKFPYGPIGSFAELDEFWLGQTEVTQGQWQRVMQTTPWTKWKKAVRGDTYPASTISWHDAMAFCTRVTAVERQQGRIGADLEYRLPTEAEWQYAYQVARNSTLGINTQAWYEKNSRGQPHMVGDLMANAWGIYDIGGNLSEWTLDRFASPEKAAHPLYGGRLPFQWHEVAADAEPLHRARGGSYADSRSALAERGQARPASAALQTIGFRVALAAPTTPTETPPDVLAQAQSLAAKSSAEPLWFVLSDLQARRDGPNYKVQLSWELVQGQLEPGKEYVVFVRSRHVTKTYLGGIYEFELDLTNPRKGIAMGEIPMQDANGPQEVEIAVIGEKAGHGFKLLVSGELKLRGRPTSAKPPAEARSAMALEVRRGRAILPDVD